MNFKYWCFRCGQNQIRLMSTYKAKNHYDSLGIPVKSTQGEVKSAYYKLSMMYHPDKNQNNAQSSEKFRDITEAYEVLGNVRTRKLYDRGLYFGGTATAREHTEDKFQRSRENRSRPPPPTGRTPIYDFDEWSKNHYGATFRRTMENRRKENVYKMRRAHDIQDVKVDHLVFVFGVIFMICMYIFQTTTSYDKVTYVGSNVPITPGNDTKD